MSPYKGFKENQYISIINKKNYNTRLIKCLNCDKLLMARQSHNYCK